jgi:hypothetical protein
MNQNNAIIVRAVSGHGFSSLSRSQTPPPSFFPRIKDDPTLFSVASHVSTNFSGPLSVSVYSPLSPLYTVCCALTHKSYYYSIEALGPRPNLFTPTPPHLIWRSCHLYNKIVGKHGAGAHDDADTE